MGFLKNLYYLNKFYRGILFFYLIRKNESTIEREDDEVEDDDDENDEQEVDVDDVRSETMEDPKEEATLDGEDNQGSTGEEGPRKLRARATANSTDVIR